MKRFREGGLFPCGKGFGMTSRYENNELVIVPIDYVDGEDNGQLTFRFYAELCIITVDSQSPV